MSYDQSQRTLNVAIDHIRAGQPLTFDGKQYFKGPQTSTGFILWHTKPKSDAERISMAPTALRIPPFKLVRAPERSIIGLNTH